MFNGQFLGTYSRADALRDELVKPCSGLCFGVAFAKSAELLAALGEDAAYAIAGGGAEADGIRSPVEAKEDGVDLGCGVKALGSHGVLAVDFEGGL